MHKFRKEYTPVIPKSMCSTGCGTEEASNAKSTLLYDIHETPRLYGTIRVQTVIGTDTYQMMKTEHSQFTIPVTGMHCASCAAGLERHLKRCPEASYVNVNIATHEAHIEGLSPEVASEVIQEAGYGIAYSELLLHAQDVVSGLSEEMVSLRCQRLGPLVRGELLNKTLKLSWVPGFADAQDIVRAFPEYTSVKKLPISAFGHTRLIVAMAGAVTVMILTMLATVPHMVVMAVATPIVFYSGAEFFQRAWSALKRGTANMYTLITIGVCTAWIYSTIVTVFPTLFESVSAVYFEASAVIVALVLLGQFLEKRAITQTGSAIEALMQLQVPVARVYRGNHIVELPVEAVETGDHVIIRPGDQVSVDGEVIQGVSMVDESMLTGEPLPVIKSAGDPVMSGTLNTDGSLTVCVTHTGRNTVLQQIVRLTREAQSRKAPIQKLADRVSGIFVPVVLGISILTCAGWILTGADIEFAINAFVSVLIIACPCALGLATPAAVVAATGAGARRGILFKGGDALEQIGRITHVLLDKTGTLTTGNPEIQAIETFSGFSESEVLQIAASLEVHSQHPLAEAIVAKAREDGMDLTPVEDVENISGRGIAGMIQQRHVHVGSRIFLAENAVQLPSSATEEGRIHVAVDGQWAGQFLIVDRLRNTSRDTVSQLHRKGLTVTMVTGDSQKNAQAVAQEVGIKNICAEATPQDKLEWISTLRGHGAVVAMVGDGINDAPALAEADIGIAIGSGTHVAVETADITLMRDDLKSVADTIRIGRKAMRAIRQNLFFAFLYNTISIPVAAGALYGVFGILLSPMLASLAMTLSSLSVVMNSLRLRNTTTN